MKFSSAVDALSKENRFLRIVVKILGAALLLLGAAVLFLFDKKPVVIERSSRGLELTRIVSSVRSDFDIQDAVKLMLRARFDSVSISPDLFISKRQLELKSAEMKELKTRGLSQSVIFRSAKISKEDAVVEFDRVFTVGEIRSALKTTVKIAFEECEPNELNPYGLKLTMAAPVAAKETK